MSHRVPYIDTAFSLDPSGKDMGRIKDDQHLKWIRTLPSVISGQYNCDACHIRYGDATYRKKRTGKGQKPDDAWTVPMTRQEHAEQHGMNEHEWWKRRNIDPCAIARQLYAVSGDTAAALRILWDARRPLADRMWKPGNGGD